MMTTVPHDVTTTVDVSTMVDDVNIMADDSKPIMTALLDFRQRGYRSKCSTRRCAYRGENL